MKPYKTFAATAVGIAALCTLGEGQALTLGAAQGAAYLGQSVRLTLPVQLQSGDDRQNLCLEAEVFYGDRRVDARFISVRAEPILSGMTGAVQVEVAQPVDEPVVTLFVRAGCTQRLGRRYLLLAELERERAVAPAPSSKVTAPSAERPTTASSAQVPAASASVATQSPETAVLPASVKPVAKAPPRSAPAARSESAVTRPPRERALPQLSRSEPAEAVLKFSTVMVASESEDLGKRAQAQTWWRALNMTEQDLEATRRQQETLQGDLRALQRTVTQSQDSVKSLGQRLEQAQSERYANPLVYALLGACLASVAGWWLWWRRAQQARSQAPWWQDDAALEQMDLALAPTAKADPLPPADGAAVTTTQLKARTPATPEVDIDIHLGDLPTALPPDAPSLPSEALDVPVPPPAQSAPAGIPGHVDFAHSTSASLRALSTREMLDIRQQAEFFMTLGQHEEALKLLREHIGNSLQSNPLVYLDLLSMLHNLGRRVDYEHYRAEFNSLFSGRVPAYGALNQPGQGLDEYPSICDQIVALWPTEGAIAFIEHCLVPDPSLPDSGMLDLDAFRDLLMLHGVLNRITSGEDTGLAPFSAAKETPAPVQDGAVDFDLSEPPGNLIEFDVSSFLREDSKPKPPGPEGRS